MGVEKRIDVELAVQQIRLARQRVKPGGPSADMVWMLANRLEEALVEIAWHRAHARERVDGARLARIMADLQR